MQQLRAMRRFVLRASALAFFLQMAWVSAQAPVPRIVFVCEHGNVKSLIAAVLFDRAAAQRGLSVRSTVRGLHPGAGVPAVVAKALKKEGDDVGEFTPQALARGDVAAARRVVAIGVELPPSLVGAAGPVERWQDIPPATTDYEAAKAALILRVDALLDALQAEGVR